jgi:hypothetical protein
MTAIRHNSAKRLSLLLFNASGHPHVAEKPKKGPTGFFDHAD